MLVTHIKCCILMRLWNAGCHFQQLHKILDLSFWPCSFRIRIMYMMHVLSRFQCFWFFACVYVRIFLQLFSVCILCCLIFCHWLILLLKIHLILLLRHHSTDHCFLRLLEELISQLYTVKGEVENMDGPVAKNGLVIVDVFEMIISQSHFMPTIMKEIDDDTKGKHSLLL